MSEPLLKLEGVVKEYGDVVKTRVLHGIDLEIRAGELISLIGPSGSGKSTLLNMIGLLDRPSAGEITLSGARISELDDDELTSLRARSLGFVFQFHHLIGALSTAENVMMPSAIQDGKTSAEARAHAVSLLESVGLGHRADDPPRQLSGGQQQRVAIARAISANPPLILADEPTGNLDTETTKGVFALLERLNEERGMAFLIVTHDRAIAARTQRVIEIVDGKIVSDAPPKQS